MQYPDGRVLRDQVRHQAAKYDDVLTDVLLIPFLPRSVDVWALSDIAALVDEARAVRDGLIALAVLNCADPGASPDNAEAVAALADVPQLVGLKASITRRKAFANATGRGLSVDELSPPDPKASGELAALLSKALSFADTVTVNGG